MDKKQKKRLMTDVAKGKISMEEAEKQLGPKSKPKTQTKFTGGKKHSKQLH